MIKDGGWKKRMKGERRKWMIKKRIKDR